MADLQRIWAPWRLCYVQVPDKQEDGCFLCRAAATDDEKGALVLWRTEHSVALLNRFPYNNGHLLIAPRAHKGDLEELTEVEVADQMRLLKRCKAALRDAIHPHGFNIGMNAGLVAGAGVPGHAHWHIVPRWQGDANFMPVVASTKVIPQSLEALWSLLRGEEA
jgi:ATP adenylyltransferase